MGEYGVYGKLWSNHYMMLLQCCYSDAAFVPKWFCDDFIDLSVLHPTLKLPDLKTGAEEQQALFEVEKMLMEVQQEHREMETQHALTAAKQDWAIPSPTDRSPTL